MKIISSIFKNTVLIWIILLLLSFNLLSQTNHQSSFFENLKTDISTSVLGAGYVLSSPIHWQTNDWLNFSVIIGSAAGISFVEKDIRKLFLRNHTNTLDKFADWGEIYGKPLTIVFLTGTLYGTGLILNDEWLRETSVILTASLLPAGFIQYAAKFGAGRARPYLELDNFHFESMKQEEDYYSFVSGHTLVSVTTSWILAKRINNKIAKSLFYSAGLICALSRIYHDEHWTSDVILGGALGIFSANSVMNWLEKKKNENKKQSVSWYFLPQTDRITLAINW